MFGRKLVSRYMVEYHAVESDTAHCGGGSDNGSYGSAAAGTIQQDSMRKTVL